MPYQTSRDKVEKHSDLLDALAIQCIREGEAYELRVRGDEDLAKKKSRLSWQIHQLLASAEEYPRNEHDRELRSRVSVKHKTGDPRLILIEPKASAELEAFAQDAIKSVKGFEKAIEEVFLKREEAEVTWAVQEDAEREHNQFREALKVNYETIHLIESEEVGGRELRTYYLAPRQRQARTKEDYRRKKEEVPSKAELAEMTDEERSKFWEEYHERKTRELLGDDD